jgi:hypothetical protein
MHGIFICTLVPRVSTLIYCYLIIPIIFSEINYEVLHYPIFSILPLTPPPLKSRYSSQHPVLILNMRSSLRSAQKISQACKTTEDLDIGLYHTATDELNE